MHKTSYEMRISDWSSSVCSADLRLPDTQRYLVMKGRDAEAESVLSRILGAGAGARKVDEIRASLAADHHRPRLADLRDKATGKVRKIVWAGIGLAVFQQLVGINIVFYYGSVLWQSVGFSEIGRAHV